MLASTGAGDTDVDASVDGGAGGAGSGGAAGGKGGDAVFTGALNATASGALTVQQYATAGMGGAGSATAAGGAGGAASATFDNTTVPPATPLPARVDATVSATGGAGGIGSAGGAAGAGGAARTAANVRATGNITLFISATGGAGGGGSGVSAGDGGAPVIDAARAVSTGGGSVTVHLDLKGGAGGSASGTGGNGASVVANNLVSASTTGAVNLWQAATAGAAGSGSPGGAGGSATSTLTLTDYTAASLTVTVTADSASSRNRPAAFSSATIAGAHLVKVSSKATAQQLTFVGPATATAYATSLSGLAWADTHATGLNPTVEGSATTAGGIITRAQASGSATGRTDAFAWHRASVAQPAPLTTKTAGYQSVAFITGLPSAADSLNALATSPNVHHDMNVTGEGPGPLSDMLAWAAFGGAPTSSGTTAQSLFAAIAESIDTTGLPADQHLLVGLLSPTLTGGGFDFLHFTVAREGLTVVDQTFTDPAAAVAYFADRTLDLGPIDDGVTGTLDLALQMDLSARAGGGFTTTLLIANATPESGPVPEPAGVAPLCGLIALARRRHRRQAQHSHPL
jgi:hypothetical protein